MNARSAAREVPLSQRLRNFLDEKTNNAPGPALPFFGSIDYPVTGRTLRPALAAYPGLRRAAEEFRAAICHEVARSRRRYAFLLDGVSEDDGETALLPDVEAVAEDIRKWKDFSCSGLSCTFAKYQGQWVKLGKTGMESDFFQPLKIRKAYGADILRIGGREMSVETELPPGWQALPWVTLRFVGERGRVLGAVDPVSLWDPATQNWRAADDETITVLGLADTYSAFERAVLREGHGNEEFYCETQGGMALHVVHLSLEHVVTSDPEVRTPTPTVTVEAYYASLRRYVAERSVRYRRYFDFGVRKFANDLLVTTDLVSLDGVSTSLLSGMHGGDDALAFGSRSSSQPQRHLRTLIASLCHQHGVTSLSESVTVSERPPVAARGNLVRDRSRSRPGELDAEAVERLREAYRLDPEAAFKGAFYKQWVPEFRREPREPQEIASTVIASVRFHPTDDVIKEIVTRRADAEPVMNAWRALWDRSFAGWNTRLASEKPTAKQKSTKKELDGQWITGAFKPHRTPSGGEVAPDISGATITGIDRVLRKEYGVDGGDRHDRDWDDVIDAACLVLAIAERCEPRGGIIDAPGGLLIVGERRDGLAVIGDASKSTDRGRRHGWKSDGELDFWNWPFALPHLGRTLARTGTAEKTALVLLDMKRQGLDAAVLTNFRQTHKVDLTSADSPAGFGLLLAALLGDRARHGDFFATESLPVRCEQRFYMVDGRIVGSTPLGAKLNALDASGRRLDARVGLRGERGAWTADRASAAAFARKARAIAFDLRRNGIHECAVDVGMTARGPVLTWLRRLDGLSLGTFSPVRYVDAFQRKRRRYGSAFSTDLAARVDRMVEAPWLRDRCRAVLERNAFQIVAVVERQYDIERAPTSSETPPADIMERTALSVVLTALLETTPVSSKAPEENA